MIPILEDIIRGLVNGTITPEQAMHWLACHEKLQAEVDVAASKVPYTRGLCVLDLLYKLQEQDDRWGPRQYPSFDPQLTADADIGPQSLAGFHGMATARRARLETAAADANGTLSWMTILVEEVAKTTEKYERDQALREQLMDVAAVAIQWAQQLTKEPQLEAKTRDNGDGTVTVEAYVEADHEGPNLR